MEGTGFHPVWITVRHFHVGLVLSRVVPIFYVLFALAGLLFLRNPFLPFFFVTSRDILQKKDRSSIFFRARACASQVICTSMLQTTATFVI
jgi:hypothetical protein